MNLDFETMTVEIRQKLSEIYHLKVAQSKFHKPNFGDFEVVSFPVIVCLISHKLDHF